MGSGPSGPSSADAARRRGTLRALDAGHVAVLRRLGLTDEEADRLHADFWEVSGEQETATYRDVMEHLEVAPSLLAERLLGTVDLDGCDGDAMSFVELAVACWLFCSLGSADDVPLHAFDLFDLDEGGVMHERDVVDLLVAVSGKGAAGRPMIEEQVHADLRGSADMTRLHFGEFARKHQTLLYPAFELFNALRRKIGGDVLWELVAARRRRHTTAQPQHPSNWRRLLRLVKTDIETGGVSEMIGADLAAKDSEARAKVYEDSRRRGADRGGSSLFGSAGASGFDRKHSAALAAAVRDRDRHRRFRHDSYGETRYRDTGGISSSEAVGVGVGGAGHRMTAAEARDVERHAAIAQRGKALFRDHHGSYT